MRSIPSGIVDLDRARPAPLYRQLYDSLRAAILAGRLAPGAHLPATRAMAAELGLARNTVLAAVEQLVAEGYLETRQGASTRVASVHDGLVGRPARRGLRATAAEPPRLAPAARDLILVSRSSFATEKTRPFRTGIPDVTLFPDAMWGRHLRRAARLLDPHAAGYAHLGGHPRLRAALSAHLDDARGLNAAPEQVIVTSSAQGALFLLALALVAPGDSVWIEEPGYLGARAALLGAGAALTPVPVDGEGMDIARATGPSPRLIYTTPSHQFPTGRLMSLGRRMALLDIAARHGAYVIEDDYDSEFHFHGRPVAAMQGLDRHGRVIYLGTFSKTMLPALRLGFLVVPDALVEPLERMQRNTGHLAPAEPQLALATFIEEGHYRAHVRRMGALYRERCDALVALIGRVGRGALAVDPPTGGMQLVARLPAGTDDAKISRRLDALDVEAAPLSRYYLGAAPTPGLFLGFAAWSEARIEACAPALDRVLGSVTRAPRTG